MISSTILRQTQLIKQTLNLHMVKLCGNFGSFLCGVAESGLFLWFWGFGNHFVAHLVFPGSLGSVVEAAKEDISHGGAI